MWTAFALRVWNLEAVPPGLTHDEASNGHDSAAILKGTHRLYFPVGYGHEPLYNYSVAGMTLLLGQSVFTLRITTVLWSIMLWVLTVALARRWWGRRAALFTGGALALGFWPLMMARVGLRAPTLPTLLAASVLAYQHAIKAASPRRAWLGYGLAGVFLGAGFYTYMASRGMPLLYVCWLIALALFDRPTLQRAWKGTLGLLLTAGLTGWPLFSYLRAHPELEQRIAQLGGALTAARAGDWRPLWTNITASLPMLLWRADPRWLYHISERPALEPFFALAFVLGLLLALWHIRDRRYSFVLLWLGGGLAPALLTTVEYNTLHAIAALPAVFLLVGYGIEQGWLFVVKSDKASKLVKLGQKYHQKPATFFWNPKSLMTGMLLLAFSLTGIEVTHAYFVTWGQNRDVRVSYHHHVVALGQHVQASSATTPVVITSMYPGEFHDSYIMEVTLRRKDVPLRWSDGRGALFIPRDVSRLYIEPQSAPLPYLAEWLEPHLTPTHALAFREADLPHTVQGYAWDTLATWDALTQSLAQNTHPAYPANYANTLTLIGHTLNPPTLHPGAHVYVLTAWEVQAPHPSELVLFTHLLDATNHIVSQADRLDAPAWQWQTGDRFVQIHTLTIPLATLPGPYTLAFGLYARQGYTRLPLQNGGDAVLVAIEIVE